MDSQIQEQIYRKYYADVYTYAFYLCRNEQLAQDLVSQTYLKAFIYLPDHITQIKSWLLRVCRNLYLDELRKQKRRTSVALDTFLPFLKAKENPKTDFEQKQKRNDLLEILQGIPMIYRDVIVQFYFMQLSINEIVEISNMNPATVKTRLYRARALLKQEMEDQEYERTKTTGRNESSKKR